jgi:acyl transferase domain-containing protein
VPNPDIDFTGLRVQTDPAPFGGGPVTTEYRPGRAPAYSRQVAPDAAYLVPLSARTPEALPRSAAALRDVLAPRRMPARQPVIFMIEIALTELLKTWGVYASCVIGHSAGEVAVAYAAGICSLEEATRLMFHRATLQQRTAGSGRMLAVSLDRAGAAEPRHRYSLAS